MNHSNKSICNYYPLHFIQAVVRTVDVMTYVHESTTGSKGNNVGPGVSQLVFKIVWRQRRGIVGNLCFTLIINATELHDVFVMSCKVLHFAHEQVVAVILAHRASTFFFTQMCEFCDICLINIFSAACERFLTRLLIMYLRWQTGVTVHINWLCLSTCQPVVTNKVEHLRLPHTWGAEML